MANKTPYFWIFCITITTALVLGGAGYAIGWYLYDNEDIIKEFEHLERELKKAQENDDTRDEHSEEEDALDTHVLSRKKKTQSQLDDLLKRQN